MGGRGDHTLFGDRGCGTISVALSHPPSLVKLVDKNTPTAAPLTFLVSVLPVPVMNFLFSSRCRRAGEGGNGSRRVKDGPSSQRRKGKRIKRFNLIPASKVKLVTGYHGNTDSGSPPGGRTEYDIALNVSGLSSDQLRC